MKRPASAKGLIVRNGGLGGGAAAHLNKGGKCTAKKTTVGLKGGATESAQRRKTRGEIAGGATTGRGKAKTVGGEAGAMVGGSKGAGAKPAQRQESEGRGKPQKKKTGRRFLRPEA